MSKTFRPSVAQSLPVLILLAALMVAASPKPANTQPRPGPSVSGQVTNVDGSGAPGVTVRLRSSENPTTREQTAVTDTGGHFNLANVPPGTYTAVFECTGLQTVTKGLRVSADRSTAINVEMRVPTLGEEIFVADGLATIAPAGNYTGVFVNAGASNQVFDNFSVVKDFGHYDDFLNGTQFGVRDVDGISTAQNLHFENSFNGIGANVGVTRRIRDGLALRGYGGATFGGTDLNYTNLTNDRVSYTRSGRNGYRVGGDGFVNPKWDFNEHFQFNIGSRYDTVDVDNAVQNPESKLTGSIVSQKNSIVGSCWDVHGGASAPVWRDKVWLWTTIGHQSTTVTRTTEAEINWTSPPAPPNASSKVKTETDLHQNSWTGAFGGSLTLSDKVVVTGYVRRGGGTGVGANATVRIK